MDEWLEFYKQENEKLKFELQQHKFGSFGEGGRNMMRIVISMIDAKLDAATSMAISSIDTRQIDFNVGRSDALGDLIHILQKELKALENPKS